MARIRTIKPEFFSSADVVQLDPLTRLLFIALWCEADREGRLEWKPLTFKIRYFPVDNCDIHTMCASIVAAGLVELYGDGLAYIPGFSKHQVINGREAESILPAPPNDRVSDASRTRGDASVGRKEGKEGKGREDASHATRLQADWQPTPEELRWALDARPDLNVKLEAESFRDYWTAKPGKDGRKADWPATWRNWIRRANTSSGRQQPAAPKRPPMREL